MCRRVREGGGRKYLIAALPHVCFGVFVLGALLLQPLR